METYESVSTRFAPCIEAKVAQEKRKRMIVTERMKQTTHILYWIRISSSSLVLYVIMMSK
jgi:hypothetical protein